MNDSSKKCLCIVSGGMDSTTLLYYMVNQHYETYALTFDYGQKHRKEIMFAKWHCRQLNVKHKLIDIKNIGKLLNSSLTNKHIEIPDGMYNEEVMRITVVPNRNMIMLSIAMGYALSLGIDNITYANHAGDHFCYYDCREEFVNKINDLAKSVDEKQLNILTPFLKLTKADILKLGIGFKIDYSKTTSCYKGGDEPCNKCGTCTERTEAFIQNSIMDPIYTKHEDWLEAVKSYEELKKNQEAKHDKLT